MGMLRIVWILLMASAAFGQAQKSGCLIVTLEDATQVLGAGTEKNELGGNCIFTLKTVALTANMTANAAPLVQMMRITAQQNGATVKDEPAVGAQAYSVANKGDHGFTIILLKGTWGATISLDYGTAKTPEVSKQKLRVLAKKALARM